MVIGRIAFSQEFYPNRTMVQWALDDEKKIIDEKERIKKIFVGYGSAYKVSPDNPVKYFEPDVKAPLRIEDEENIPSFESTIRDALNSINDQEKPNLIISITSHGGNLEGLFDIQNSTLRSHEVNGKIRIAHRELIDVIFKQIDFFEKEYGRKVSLDFLYLTCYGNSIFPYLEAKTRSQYKGLYSNGGAYTYNYKVNFLTPASESEVAFSASPDSAIAVSLEILNSNKKGSRIAKKNTSDACLSISDLSYICLTTKNIYQPFWSSYQNLPTAIHRIYYDQDKLKAVDSYVHSTRPIYKKIATANLYSQLGDSASQQKALDLIKDILDDDLEEIYYDPMMVNDLLSEEIARILVKLPSNEIIPIIQLILSSVELLSIRDNIVHWTGVALLNLGTYEALAELSSPIYQDLGNLYEVGLAIHLTEYDEEKGLSYLRSFYEFAENEEMKEQILEKIKQANIPGEKAKMLLAEFEEKHLFSTSD